MFHVTKRMSKPSAGASIAAVGSPRSSEQGANANTIFDKRLIDLMCHPLLVTLCEGGTCSMSGSDFKSADIVGRGAFATVFELGLCRCVKVERTMCAMSMEIKLRSIATAQAMGEAVLGPRVHAWRIVQHETSMCIVLEMDRIDGRTLRTWLSEEKRTREQVQEVCDRVAPKVGRMHSMGFRHNDLHVSNIMLDRADTPWLIDFTFASFQGDGVTGDEAPDLLSSIWLEHRMRHEMHAP